MKNTMNKVRNTKNTLNVMGFSLDQQVEHQISFLQMATNVEVNFYYVVFFKHVDLQIIKKIRQNGQQLQVSIHFNA